MAGLDLAEPLAVRWEGLLAAGALVTRTLAAESILYMGFGLIVWLK